jgi:hypothetical protein
MSNYELLSVILMKQIYYFAAQCEKAKMKIPLLMSADDGSKSYKTIILFLMLNKPLSCTEPCFFFNL